MKGYTTAGVGFNGETKEGYEGMRLPEVLEKEQYDIRRIAVEINGEIITRSLFSETVVKSGDHLEVVSFVGGG